MLKYLPKSSLHEDQMGHMAHTDVGSLTLLFTATPGLQIFQRAKGRRVPADPQVGKIFVNVGDALSFISGMRLVSCIHRVVPDSGAMGFKEPRLAIAFFCRPELSATFTDGEGRKWTGEEWHRVKYRIFRVSNEEQGGSALLTGRAGFLGHL